MESSHSRIVDNRDLSHMEEFYLARIEALRAENLRLQEALDSTRAILKSALAKNELTKG